MVRTKKEHHFHHPMKTESLSLSSGFLSIWQLLFDLPDEQDFERHFIAAFARDEAAIRSDWEKVGKDAWLALDSIRYRYSR